MDPRPHCQVVCPSALTTTMSHLTGILNPDETTTKQPETYAIFLWLAALAHFILQIGI